MSVRTYTVEESTRLSKSMIWDLQKKFYETKGEACWTESIVPQFVTSNSYIAYQYANCILGYLRDYYLSPSADKTKPVYIIEIGAGHGKLGYLIVNHLIALQEFFPPGVAKPFVYVVTDFVESMVNFCKSRKCMEKHVQAGWMDFAVFNCETDKEIFLQVRKEVLNEKTLGTPMVAVANYVFNGLKQDAFSINNGIISEGCVKVCSESESFDPEDITFISRMNLEWSYQPVTLNNSYFEDPVIAKILRMYSERHHAINLLMPVGAFACIKTLQLMSHGQLLLLSADKAHSHEDDLKQSKLVPHLATHGSFSFMTNFHAIRLYFLNQGGFTLHTPYYSGLKVAAFVLGGKQPEFIMSWDSTISSLDPDSFSQLQRCIYEETPSPSLKNILAVIRLSRYESDVFIKFKQVLIDRIPYASEKIQNDFRNDIAHIASNYYPLTTVKDVDFDLGRLSMVLRDYIKSISLFQKSMDICGEHHVTWHNMGICYYYMDKFKESQDCFARCLQMQPGYKDAESWKSRVETQMAAAASPAAAQ